MERAERAKQFMPFAALKGYPDALRKKEEIIAAKAELSEELKAALDIKLSQVCRNDIITVVYFSKGKYLQQTGMVVRIDTTTRILQVVNTKISFDGIYDICGDKIKCDV